MTAPPDEQLLRFRAGGRALAISAASVRAVSPLPRITEVPHAPPSLLGIGNIRGEARSIISVARLLGLPEQEPKRLIMLADHPTALAVDRVDGVSIRAEDCELPRFADLLAEAFPVRAVRGKTRATAGRTKRGAASTERLALLGFEVTKQPYALPLEDVETVIAASGAIAPIPRSDAATLGMIVWQNESLPCFSLSTLLGIGVDDDACRYLVIIRIGLHAVALRVDRVTGLLRPPLDRVDPLPQALLRGGGEAVIQAVYRPEGGGCLVSILSADHLLREDVTARLVAGGRVVERQEQVDLIKLHPLLVFDSNGHMFAIPIDAVSEVARAPSNLRRLPRTPAFLAGLTSHRGAEMAVVDLSMHLGGGKTGGRQMRMLVVTIAGAPAGLLVERVHGIRYVREEKIARTPPLGDRREDQYGEVIGTEEGGEVTLMLSPDALLREIVSNLIPASVGADCAA